ncbi:hypothetical protein [Parageobacillus thermoglucosidasius]|uniref:hypothetical protein n=1 Tax=Parageobacillus thermoglucosidasius TaxID=1426 RepID=UPI001FCC283B|nr:hypothetical protein [Parageobacillus thermoglucosidasius]BDG33795.1 hypothetical protein PthBH41_35070 [Parageobacillus thermoglucosidasius]
MNKQQYQQKRIQYIQELFELNPDLFDHRLVPDIRPKGSNRVVATLPLNHHEIYGETVLFINEKLDENGNIERYNYGWEYSQRERRMGRSELSVKKNIKTHHIV